MDHILHEVNPRQTFERTRRFFETRIWTTPRDVPRRRAWLYRLGRMAYTTVRGVDEKNLAMRAAALTYYTVLSIVPFLAFVFAVLTGFGVSDKLIEGSLRPYLQGAFAGNASLLKALEQMLSFVQRTHVSGLSVVGILFLAYTSISMLSSVETALNDIWEAHHARPILKKVTDYTTLIVVGPLLMVTAITLVAAAQSSSVVSYLHESFLLGDVVDFFLRLTPVVLGCVGLVALYVIMPNVPVRMSSALFGGGIAGLAWLGLLILHVKFQIGVARYNALYSGFAALPIFLVWLYMSWIVVLVGAQLAASHQYEGRLQQAARARHIDQELRETLAVVVSAMVSRRFLEGRPPATAAALEAALELPSPAIEPVLDALVEAGVLVRVVQRGEPGYDPGRDVDAVRRVDLEDAVRHDPSAQALKSAVERVVGPGLAALLRDRHDDAPPSNPTLRQLANQCDVP